MSFFVPALLPAFPSPRGTCGRSPASALSRMGVSASTQESACVMDPVMTLDASEWKAPCNTDQGDVEKTVDPKDTVVANSMDCKRIRGLDKRTGLAPDTFQNLVRADDTINTTTSSDDAKISSYRPPTPQIDRHEAVDNIPANHADVCGVFRWTYISSCYKEGKV